MNVFITGINGFIGQHLKGYLESKKDYKLFCPSSKELDMSNEMAVDSYVKKIKPDCIIHLANKGGGRDTLDLRDIAEYNLRMFFAIMKQSSRVEKIIHFGSGAEYGKHKPIVKATESSYKDFMPLDSYGFYKNIASRFVESCSDNVMCLRIFGCYGANENYRYKFISNAIVKNLLHLPITIYKDCLFDYIYIDDLLRIIDHFLHNQAQYKLYNASSGKGVLLSTLAEMINETSSYKSPIIILEKDLNNEYTSDNSRLLEEIPNFSFTPHTSAIEMIRNELSNNLSNLDIESIKADPYLAHISKMWQAPKTTQAAIYPDKTGGGG